ncbi:hypothetical protein [Rhodopirellula bahusiensis]|uniref:hypothetical protein n=1 Tax=Rhodopirellula bahusiensis TaxID=2014065 RepID=UPI0032666FEF
MKIVGCLALLVCTLSSVVFATTAHSQGIVKADDPLVLGKWTVTKKTESGSITLIKEHADGTTTLTAYDSAKRVLYAKTSLYHTEKHGGVKVFVLSNSQFTAGPNAGKRDRRTKQYVYRVDADQFFEVRGMVENTKEPPAIIVWERVDAPAI